MMRNVALATVMVAATTAAVPARAQTYDPSYPVCLTVYGPASYIECRYTSLEQCRLSASGRPAQCAVNPFAANAQIEPSARRVRRTGRGY